MNRIRRAVLAWQTLGPGWIATRARLAWSVRGGGLRRRLPLATWDDPHPAARLPAGGIARDALRERLLPDPALVRDAGNRRRLAAWDAAGGSPLPAARRALEGRLALFGGVEVDVGSPPDWHRDPFDGSRFPADVHWTRIGDFDRGDVKNVWEPARFGAAHLWLRAAAREDDGAWGAAFWDWLDAFVRDNPPQAGPHWKCGQETSLRAIGWCVGLAAFLDHPAATPERLARLARALAISADRVEAHVLYAKSQRNNHAVSEGAGLWTVGLLFPDLPRAERWARGGAELLAWSARELVYDDGAFAQSSASYHRLALETFCWCLALARRCGRPLPDAVRDAARRMTRFLVPLCDPADGAVPNYGENDGARLLDWANGAQSDYRPALQAAAALTGEPAPFPPGPWDEQALWLCGAVPATAAGAGPDAPGRARSATRHEAGAVLHWRRGGDALFARCGAFRDRPGHADQLHTSIRIDGRDVAVDAGTYRYNAPVPWDHPLSRAEFHNTVTVDGAEPMERATRFLWLPWPGARLLRLAGDPARGDAVAVAAFDGWTRLAAPVRHVRAWVALGALGWLVLDALRSARPHRYRLHWLLADLPAAGPDARGRWTLDPDGRPVTVATAAVGDAPESPPLAVERGAVRADPDSPRGWIAPHYAARVPGLSIACVVEAPAVRFATLFAPFADASLAPGAGGAWVVRAAGERREIGAGTLFAEGR